MNVKKDILWRVIVSILMLVFLSVGIVYQIVNVQYVQGEHWNAVDDSLHVKYQTIPAVRGSIYSEDGSLLATSVPIYKISLDFGVIHEFHKDSFGSYKNILATRLANTLQNRTSDEYLTVLEEGYRLRKRYVTIIRNASFLQSKEIMSWPIFSAGRYKGGIVLEEKNIRKKPYYELMARTIGYINENHKGAGIEASFDEILTGADGKMVVRKVPGGYRPLENDMKISATNGKDIFTTVDIGLQDLVNEELSKGILDNGAAYGTAVLLEVKTGKIKAIANINNTTDGLREYFNHAIGTGYEPGSTIKLVSALAALENNDVELDDSIDVHYGSYKFFKNDSIEDSGHTRVRKMTYQQVFENSSNVGISITAFKGFKKDPVEFIKYFEELKLTEPLETGIKGEVIPSILRPTRPGWSGMAVPSMSIGYSVSMSPLHIAMLYNAVANDGVMMRPYLIAGIGSLGQLDEHYEPLVYNSKICKQSTLDDLRTMLEGVVQNGTAKALKDLPFRVAGKTGTSRISDNSEGYTNEYHSSFAGYFPADNPKYTLVVMISRPSKGRIYGSQVALPVFKEIASKIYANAVHARVPYSDTTALPNVLGGKYSDVKKVCKKLNLDYDVDARNQELVVLKSGEGELVGKRIDFQKNVMPDVKGLGLSKCLFLFENKGYKVRQRGIGKVVEQSPLPGTVLTPGRTIYLRLSTDK